VLACLGLAVIAVLLIRLHRPLLAPDLAAFDAGKPALSIAGERVWPTTRSSIETN
jgi:hypothetical protein